MTLINVSELALQSGSLPNKLQTLDVKYLNNEECNLIFGSPGYPDVDYGHVCTFNDYGQGACNVSNL